MAVGEVVSGSVTPYLSAQQIRWAFALFQLSDIASHSPNPCGTLILKEMMADIIFVVIIVVQVKVIS